MPLTTADSKVAQPSSPVKSLNYQLPLPLPEPMIHHKDRTPKLRIIYKNKRGLIPPPYGVSSSQRVLSPQLLLKRHNLVHQFLEQTLGLTTSQREVTFRLLRYWAYYGKVYPKQSQVSNEPGCSKATFWRTIRTLEDRRLIQVVNRFVIRPHAQISNLYRFDKLLLIIARYLAEHGQRFYEKWLEPYLAMPGRLFWSLELPFIATSSGGLPLDSS